ncbi:MAG: dihydroorotase [Candidatus Gracilibacteria bacterium]|jgi:dihydroorotase|nr:dihydroorotase [Candidatus Gracilibacteria bacterium]
MKSILIKNGHIIDPKNNVNTQADILIKDGKIAKIGKISERADQEIDAKGMIVTPGLIDMHVHFREPGFEGKETILTGSKSAIRGGITSVLTMPNTNPPTDNAIMVAIQQQKANKANYANIFISGCITQGQKGERLANLTEMVDQGIIALTDDGHDVFDEFILKNAYKYANDYNLPLLVHAEIPVLGKGHVNEGEVSFKLGLEGIPHSAEDIAIYKNIILAQEADAQIHIGHIATKGGVEAVKFFKEKGVKVSAEAAPHHFALTDQECLDFNTNCKMYPPLRTEEDKKAIIKGLQDGTIEVIATDHAPHKKSEKNVPFQDAPRGTIGTETCFSAINTYLVKTKALSIEEAICKMTKNPSKILKINKGGLAIGDDADVAIFDTEAEWLVKKEDFISKSCNSAFIGKSLQGKCVHTIVGGEIKMQNSKVI